MWGMRLVILGLIVSFSVAGALNGFAGEGDKKQIPMANLTAVGPALAKEFTFQPVHPPLPNHLWMDVGNGQVRFLHFNKAVTEEGAGIIFIGDGIKGTFCAENQPDGGKTGFVHFHSSHKMEGAKHGHGGNSGTEGYWLRHIAVGKFEMKNTNYTPGIAHNFMHTDPPKCAT